jgi:putative component of membrane protein insertase Oxa1/YidC/SpoIIIJ protein YidD
MKSFFIFFTILSLSAFAQSEKAKWEKADYSYRIDSSIESRDYSISFDNPLNVIAKSVINVYWYFISDLDGDNCPFHPSCSSFFVDAVRQTNIVQGTLMFFDRFTRDASVVGRFARYPKYKSGKLFDPAHLYTLNPRSFIPASTVIDAE